MKTRILTNKNAAQSLDQKAMSGVDKYFSHVKSITIAGTSFTPTTLKAVLQAEIDANQAVDETEAQLRQQVVAAKLARAKAQATRAGLKAYVLGTSGADAVQMLKDFGIPVLEAQGREDGEVEGAVGRRLRGHAKGEEGGHRVDRRARPRPAPRGATRWHHAAEVVAAR